MTATRPVISNPAARSIRPLALKGTPLGWQGPWGTTYAANLRLIAKDKGSEDGFVQYAKTFQARPPMPFFNVHAMDESDIRSLYQYIVSLGEPGDAGAGISFRPARSRRRPTS